MDTPKLLRVPEVAKVFNVSRPTVYRMVNSGDLEAYSIGGSVRIPATAVERYLMTNRLGPRNRAAIGVDGKADPPSAKAGAKGRARGAYVSARPTPEMIAERKAWLIARRMAVKLVAADATDAQWDEALQTAYREARKRIKPAPVEA